MPGERASSNPRRSLCTRSPGKHPKGCDALTSVKGTADVPGQLDRDPVPRHDKLTNGQTRRGNRGSTASICLILLYALVANIIEKPDGLTISAFFILGIVAISLVSRVARTTELRADVIRFDDNARRFIKDSLDYDGELNLIANRRQAGDVQEYAEKERDQRGQNAVPGAADIIFVEIDIIDPSDFGSVLDVKGVEVNGYRVLRAESPAAPNALTAILLAPRDITGVIPHAYFEWSERSPLAHLMRYLLLGRGDTPPVVREILRKHEPDPARRPRIHVG